MAKRIDKVNMVTLGCSKNLVDAEVLMGRLKKAGFKIRHNSNEGDGEIVIINTCGFIGEAKEESINTILSFVEGKHRGEVAQIIVMGCLSERYREELMNEIPEIDRIYGKFDWNQVLEYLGVAYMPQHDEERYFTTPAHYAYVKVSEGCNRACSYCAIPIITGKHQSRAMEDIESEVKLLVSKGIKEIQIIAQDLSYYGFDKYGESKLAELINNLCAVDGLDWIRLHYAYPSHFPFDLLPVIKNQPKVCNYLDIALQHISDRMLKKMRRNVTKQETLDLITRIRKEVPGIHLRTTMLVGHPGETEEDFQEMLAFVEEAQFERLGAFPYSEEEGTYAAINYTDDIPEEVKTDRYNRLMEAQRSISRVTNELKIGTTQRVIIDREEDQFYIGRTEFDSPEVDPEVLIAKRDKAYIIGEFYNLEIDDADDYDLYVK